MRFVEHKQSVVDHRTNTGPIYDIWFKFLSYNINDKSTIA